MPRRAITKFTGPYRWLSNFWPCIVVYEGMEYPSSEHAYQAAKFKSNTVRILIRNSVTPGRAKRKARQLYMRSDWDDVKVDIMSRIVYDKFIRTKNLRDALLATKDAELIEGNTWDDTFWGSCNGVGENHLGKILMDVRTIIQNMGKSSI